MGNTDSTCILLKGALRGMIHKIEVYEEGEQKTPEDLNDLLCSLETVFSGMIDDLKPVPKKD